MRFLRLIAAVLLILGLGSVAWAEPPQAGDLAPKVNFSAPNNIKGLKYLGLDLSADSFTWSDVRARLVICSVYNLHCPHCQREAPNVNLLFTRLKETGLASDVKLFGVGVSNNFYEVVLYRDEFKVPFPLIPDPDLKAHQALGGPATPHFLVIANVDGPGQAQVVYSQAGELGDVDKFINMLMDNLDREWE